MILNDGVEDTVCFHTCHRTTTSVINELGYVLWNTDIVLLNEVSFGVTSRCFEVNQILNDYFAAEVFS
jgi:hypothetical protein